jgi:hypothetical protein
MKAVRSLGIAACAAMLLPLARADHDVKPLPHPIRQPGQPGAASSGTSASGTAASPWTPLVNQPTFLADGASNPILLTDGTILIQDAGFPDWWKLTPDSSGSYVNGTWSQMDSLPATYSPLYHSTAVLPDGRMIIEGGEYLLNAAQTALVPTWTAQGAIYDPVANVWTMVAPPPFFVQPQTIGDAQSVVLPNGIYMQADCCSTQGALLDARNLTWSPTGTGKADWNDEEGWTLLPNGKVLTVDAYVASWTANGTNSELYSPWTGSWTSAGSTIVQLWDSSAACGGEAVASQELGPGVLRPDGTVFYAGSNQCGAGHTAIYNFRTGKWAPGPDFPNGLDIADGPAALEANGKVLMMTSPGIFNAPSTFFEWDGHDLDPVPGPPNAPVDSSYFGNMLVLPTGQILLTDFSNDIEIYTPSRPGFIDYAPFVIAAPEVVSPGLSYEIVGFGFNGVSQGAAYGDDVQAATNYPLVRITNLKSGHVFYARTHDHSFMGVASELPVLTHFDVARLQEPGPSKLEVVANGVPSQPVFIFVK